MILNFIFNVEFCSQNEIDALKEQVSVKTKTIAETKEKLQKELQSHTQIIKDIEVSIMRSSNNTYSNVEISRNFNLCASRLTTGAMKPS